MYDLVIIGGGPAGAAAGVYAARKRLKTIFITDNFGGQSIVSGDIQNWVGVKSISGEGLAKALKGHVEAYASDILEIKSGEKAESVSKTEGGFSVKTKSGEYKAKTILIATGSVRRKLDVPGAAEFENKGITYCATCDGPLFAGMDVVVIGGGNAGFETAAQLLAYAKSVTLLHKNPEFKADPVTVKKVLANPNMKAIPNATLKEVKGDKFVSSIVYTDGATGEEHEISVSGVFSEIGQIPATFFVEGLVELNEYKQVKVDPRTQTTSVPGVWAAGDCTDGKYHQNNIAAGDAVKALEDIYNFLHA